MAVGALPKETFKKAIADVLKVEEQKIYKTKGCSFLNNLFIF